MRYWHQWKFKTYPIVINRYCQWGNVFSMTSNYSLSNDYDNRLCTLAYGCWYQRNFKIIEVSLLYVVDIWSQHRSVYISTRSSWYRWNWKIAETNTKAPFTHACTQIRADIEKWSKDLVEFALCASQVSSTHVVIWATASGCRLSSDHDIGLCTWAQDHVDVGES